MLFRTTTGALALALSALVTTSVATHADVRLPALFTDGMVFQQGIQAPVWGWADEGEVVTVQFKGKSYSSVASNGRWSVKLPKMAATSAPETLVVSGNNRIEVSNVVVGEVWVCSGQSNMQWAMTQSHDPAADIAASANPNIRLFYVPRVKAKAPLTDVKAKWEPCDPKTVAGFSAVAYYFGRDLQAALGVPVGLIHTSWGGSPAEVWLSEAALAANPRYQTEILDTYPGTWRGYQRSLEQYRRDEATAKAAGKPVGRGMPYPPWQPAELYNGMIAPLLPYAIKGAIWYQGESNAGRAHQYRSLFADMIRNWRSAWGQGDFAFLQVQLAPWDKNKKRSLAEITAYPVESDWAELREAQSIVTRTLPNVGMAVITDFGDKDDIHPSKKAPVGGRLALLARSIAYKQKLVATGPTYKALVVHGDRAFVHFDSVGGGLEARGGDLTGFAIAGKDGVWHWGKAMIDGHRVIVSSPKVAKPVAVRYGWADFPAVNLFNANGLPASPFRTDDFPMLTAPKR